jgi:hypothetical protein
MIPNSAERELWQTVVFLAVKDALEGRDQYKAPLSQVQADRWIRGGGKDFRLVCSLAGIEPEFLREAYVSGRIRLELLVASETHNRRAVVRELVASERIGGDRRSAYARVS